MKNIITSLISGLFGGIVVLVAFNYYLPNIVVEKDSIAKATPVTENITLNSITGPSFVDAAKKATGAVVHIYAEESADLARQRYQDRKSRRQGFNWFFDDFFDPNFFGGDYFKKNGSGSGVIYTRDGYIVTNNHVVGFADKITVTLQNGKKYNATKIGTDPSSDLAVIKIEADNLKTMDIADSDKIQVGEWVLAVGNPFDYLTSTVTAGIVSAKGRDLDIIDSDKSIEEFIQTDAAINPGNSGGALVTDRGELVGINTAIATPTGVYAGYSFAIPSNLMKSIVDDIIQTGGDIYRVNLGVGGYDVDSSLQKEYELKVNKGFYVADVEKRSSAMMAGILPGDVIVGIDGKSVANFDDISDILKFSKSGDKLNIEVSRNGKNVSIPTFLRKSM